MADTNDQRRLSRRDILRRGAIVGGSATALWAAPQLTTRALAAACAGSPLCYCGVYRIGTSTAGWTNCTSTTLPTDCGGVLHEGLPPGYSFTITTSGNDVIVTLVKDDTSECDWGFSEAYINLDCAPTGCKVAALSGTGGCKRTATFTYSGGIPSNIETCFNLYFRLCGCTP